MGWEKNASQIRYSATTFTTSMMVISLASDDQRGLSGASGEGMVPVSCAQPPNRGKYLLRQ